MLNISNYELESANNTLIINDIKFEIDKIENISYNFYVGNELYITKIRDYDYMIELSIPNVELLIPPFDESSKFRINSNEQILKNIYFNAILNLN